MNIVFIELPGESCQKWVRYSDVAALEKERDKLDAEVHSLESALRMRGLSRCDSPACNCGSWHPSAEEHARRERRDTERDELKEAVRVLGEELSVRRNRNGMPRSSLFTAREATDANSLASAAVRRTV